VGCASPSGFLPLLVAVLGFLSGCQPRDLERLPSAIKPALKPGVGSLSSGGHPTDSPSRPICFLQVEMWPEILPAAAGVAARPDPRVRIGSLDQSRGASGQDTPGSIVQTDGGGGAFISQGDALLQRPWCVPIAQAILRTRESHGAVPYCGSLFGHDGSRRRLFPGPTRFITPENVFSAASRSRGPDFLLTVESKPKDPASPRSGEQFLYSRKDLPLKQQCF